MDVVALLKEHNVDYREGGEHEHVTKNFVGVDCPLCSPSWKHYRLGISLRTGGMSCWACGRMKRAETWAAVLGLSVGKAVALLRAAGGHYRAFADEPDGRGKLVLPPDCAPLLPPHERYLEGRGLDPNILANVWGVRGIGSCGGRYAWRVFIPVFRRGKMVSWTTRSISDKHSQRYLAAEASQEVLNHRHLLYGEDLCRGTVVIVEGPSDAWRIGPGAAATFGTGLTRQQVLRMARFAVRVVCFDSDAPGRKRAGELFDMLAPLPGQTFKVTLETGKDPGSADPGEIEALRRRFLDRPGPEGLSADDPDSRHRPLRPVVRVRCRPRPVQSDPE